MAPTWAAGDNVTAEKLNRPGIKALGRRQTNSSGTTTSVGVLRLDDIPIKAGRSYDISMNPQLASTVANDVVFGDITHTTDGSTPTTASPILSGSNIYTKVVGASSGETRKIVTNYEPASDQTLSLLVRVGRLSGTGTVTTNHDAANELQLKITDVGAAVGNTGTSV